MKIGLNGKHHDTSDLEAILGTPLAEQPETHVSCCKDCRQETWKLFQQGQHERRTIIDLLVEMKTLNSQSGAGATMPASTSAGEWLDCPTEGCERTRKLPFPLCSVCHKAAKMEMNNGISE